MKVFPWLFCVLLSLACFQVGWAQNQTITGVVTDADTGQPIVGAEIRGGVELAITDEDGRFSVVTAAGSTLVITHTGYLPVVVAPQDRESLRVALEIDAGLLEQIITLGYGERSSIAQGQRIAAADASAGMISSPEQLIQGRVPGLSILQSGGEPGAPITSHMRGITSISSSNAPLYVVDGIPIDNLNGIPSGIDFIDSGRKNPLVFLSSYDIATVDVVKDAGAAAIYGGRGANGVILINTQAGQSGDLRVDYRALASASEFIRPLPLVSPEAYERFVRANGLSVDYLGGSSTDWQDAVTRTALSHSHHLAASGGAQRTRYRVSAGYMNQEGVINESGLERLSGTLHMRHRNRGGRFGVDMRILGSAVRDDRVPISQTAGYYGGLLSNVLRFNPTYPVYNADGNFHEAEGTGVFNPVALARQVDDVARTRRMIGSLRSDYQVSPGLSVVLRMGIDRHRSGRDIRISADSPLLEIGVPGSRQAQNTLGSTTGEATIRYTRPLENTRLHVLGGALSQTFFRDGFHPDIPDLALSATPATRWSHSQHAVFVRTQYSIHDRYYVTASLRQEFSTRFGDELESALFPALALGWQLSGLDAASSPHVFHVRFSYGRAGVQDFEPVGSYGSWGRWPSGDPHAGLAWEKTSQFNLGLDYNMWRGRLTGSLDLYHRSTSDMLIEEVRPLSSGYPTQLVNAGQMRNLGFEFMMQGRAFTGTRSSVDAGMMVHGSRNRILNLGSWSSLITGYASGPGLSVTASQVIAPGQPFGTFRAPIFAGFDASGRELCRMSSGATADCAAVPPDDWENVGKSLPDIEYSFWTTVGLNRWDMRALVRGALGRHVFNNLGLAFSTKSLGASGFNFLSDALDDPAPITEGARYSSRWIQNASFLRLESVELGYTLGSTIASQGYLDAIRIFLAVNNAFVITPYSGWDPEVSTESFNTVGIVPILSSGIDFTNYPRPRTFTVGIHVAF